MVNAGLNVKGGPWHEAQLGSERLLFVHIQPRNEFVIDINGHESVVRVDTTAVALREPRGTESLF
jgi:hypothetical protein